VLDLETRTAILRLRREGHGIKRIARALGLSPNSVRSVLRSGEAEVPALQRDERLVPHVERVRVLHAACKGNLVRVWEELCAEGIEVSYQAVTAFCRRHQIGQKPKRRVGHYEFAPGQEMQHDTSPHGVKVGGRLTVLQCAGLVQCFSTMRYVQCYPRWNRFQARVFLTEAIQYFGGAAVSCMVDNSNVVVLRGTGADAVMVPGMAAFAERFGFTFHAHEKGDADRSAHVERGFHTVENNFYPGRTFADLDDLNAKLRIWCDTRNATWNSRLHASPRELFAAEVGALQPLPLHIPEVYELHHRRVDTEGFVHLHTNRYSVSEEHLGRQLCLHEHDRQVRIFDGHRLLLVHDKLPYGAGRRQTLPEHRGRKKPAPPPPLPEEAVMRQAAPELAALLDALHRRHGGQAARAVRHLHRMFLEYPTEPVVRAVARALEFGLLDLARIEEMVLRLIGGDFFRLPIPEDDEHGR
jgi:transposase